MKGFGFLGALRREIFERKMAEKLCEAGQDRYVFFFVVFFYCYDNRVDNNNNNNM